MSRSAVLVPVEAAIIFERAGAGLLIITDISDGHV